jgi:hypothetical protein
MLGARILLLTVSLLLSASLFAQRPNPNFRPQLVRRQLPAPPLPLVRMMRAEHQQSYSGREIIQDKKGTRERLVKHHPTRGTRRESIVPPGETLLDNYQNSFILLSNGGVHLKETSTYAELARQHESFLQRLQNRVFILERQGTDTIAGRPADVVRIGPRVGKRGPTWRLWLDKETGLRLRLEQQDPEGRIVFSAYYVSIDFSPTFAPQDFTPPTEPKNSTRPFMPQRFPTIEAAQKAGHPLQIPSTLRENYRLKEVIVPQNARRMTTVWTTGMTTISLVQMRYSEMPPALARQLADKPGYIAEKAKQRRAYGWRKGEYAFLLIADLSEDELNRIATSK